jgi:hypothetical protein
MVRFLLALLVLTAFDAAAQSPRQPPMSRQDLSSSRNAIETPHITVTTSSPGTATVPGSRISLLIDIAPKPKMHVYSPLQETYIPVSIKLEPQRTFRALAPVFPKAEKYFFAPLKETQLVYSKPFRIVQEVTLASAAVLRDAGHASGGHVTVEGTLRYQACDDAICYLPRTVPVSWTIALKRSAMQ